MKKILVIDDDESTRNMLRQLLEVAGFDVIDADDGIDGIYLAKHEKPDLILLDLAMPELDGIETCKIMKAFERLRGIPVVMISAIAERQLADIAINEGAADYLEKSFSKNELLEKISQYL